MEDLLHRMRSMFINSMGTMMAGFLLLLLPAALPGLLLYRIWDYATRRKMEVAGKVVLVTGASAGIGRHLALEYAKRGAMIVLVARREHLLREVAAKCMANGARDAAICPADVSREEECKRIVDFAISNFGKLDILVNNAGASKSLMFEEEAIEDLRASMDLNFWGNLLTTKYALDHLRRVKGQVIAISSIAAFVPNPRLAIYNAAKGATAQFYDTIRYELSGQEITITVVMPGVVESELTKGSLRDYIPSSTPMLSTTSAANSIVEAGISGKRYHIVPFWYATSLPYRVVAPELLEWPSRLFLLGKPPTRGVEMICSACLGEDNTRKLFKNLQELTL